MGLRDLVPDFLWPGPSKNPYAGMLSNEAWQYYRRQHKEWIRHLTRKMQEYSRESRLPARLR